MEGKSGSFKIFKHRIEKGNLQYHYINFNELKPKRWIHANDFPDEQVEFDYWIDVLKHFTDVSRDFLSNSNFRIDVPELEHDSHSDSLSDSQSVMKKEYNENIAGIEEIFNVGIDKKLFIPEIVEIKDFQKSMQNNCFRSKPSKQKDPYILLQYYSDPTIESSDQSENDPINNDEDKLIEIDNLLETDELDENLKEDYLQVILPTYSIKKQIYDEKNELFLIDDLKYAGVAHGVSKRYNSTNIISTNKLQKNEQEHKKKVLEKKNITNSIGFGNGYTPMPNNFIDDDQHVSIKSCFEIDNIIFFVVEISSKNIANQDDQNSHRTICLPENIMKNHFPNILINYFEKCIVFNK